MSRRTSQFDSFVALGGSRATRLTGRLVFLRSLFFLLLLALAGGNALATRGATARNSEFAPAATNPSFAVADFDGDHRPDLASVQSGIISSGTNSYRIQLQLSAVGRQSIQLFAPAGGLVVEARDVNGDHAIDLVLTTAWLRRPVAIFLNDGHGKFSRAEPSAFPGAFNRSNKGWASTSTQEAGAVSVPPQSWDAICLEDAGLVVRQSVAKAIPASSSGFAFSPFLASHAGRAPPAEITL